MRFIYTLLLFLIFLLLLPYFIYQGLVNRKYIESIRERMGWLPKSLRSDVRPAIWLHAVSVGESLAALPLLKLLRARFPDHRLFVTTTTATGQSLARSKMTMVDGFAYFPYDWPFSVKKALGTIRPRIVILMESELWLNFLSECGRQSIPALVANGRISDRSFNRSVRFGFFVNVLYGRVSRFCMQTRLDAERAIALGAARERVSVSGNIKYDIDDFTESTKAAETTRLLDKSLALSSRPLIIAGSTSEGEEEIILDAFKSLKKTVGMEGFRLLIAPRHPERFEAVAGLIESSGLSLSRRSLLPLNDPARVDWSDVILLDSIGELASLYRFASIVIVGGSFIFRGGHNILEPAVYEKPIVIGPHMENFRDITNEFLRRDALIQLKSQDDRQMAMELGDILIGLAMDKERASTLGANAIRAVRENRGATARTVDVVEELLGRGNPKHESR